MKVGIVGGGFMGLALAHKITKMNAEVTVFEAGPQLGGLSTYHDYGPFIWDKFYHVILPTDSDLIAFIEELGLGDRLCWRPSFTGYYVQKKFHSISNVKEFLRFPPLGMFDKLMLGYTIFRGSKIKDWKRLEKITVKDWLISIGGKNTFEKFWAPLLLAKLGKNYEQVSAVFIWTYIKRLFEARESPVQKEHMGYVAGGYRTVFDRLEQSITESGSQIVRGTAIDRIFPDLKGGIKLSYGHREEHFDKVIFTAPLNVLGKVAPPKLVEISQQGDAIQYLGVICLVLVTKTPLTPYYVLNIADGNIPFTGVIGMSSLVDLNQTQGNHLTYFPKYVTQDHPYWSLSEGALTELFLKGVQDLYPDFDHDHIISAHLNKAVKVQPLQVLHYSEKIPKITSKHPDFYVLNTSQFVNDTLNNNSVAKHVNHFMSEFKSEFSPIKNND
ncbi:MAG: NAD(P)/FAD-dependent oxidoreductase [Flavobacteriaceae bacterium]